MTISRRSYATALQLFGLLGSGLALVAIPLSGESCMGPIYLVGAAIAVVLDLVAIRVAPSSAGIGAAIGKLALVSYAMVGVVVLCAVPRTYIEPLIPSGTGALILLWSSVPSLLGAIGRRLVR